MAKKVLVGMSGGVDSAACVLLLQKQGYAVSGVTLRLHHYKDRPGTCGSADDIEEAARVAAQMGISHRVLDLCDLFRREVMGHFVSEYCAGRTPTTASTMFPPGTMPASASTLRRAVTCSCAAWTRTRIRAMCSTR